MTLPSEEHIFQYPGQGRIEVICGSMFSGKTEELIRRLKRAKFAKQRVEIFKPAIDTRYSQDNVVSHDSNSIPSTPVDSSNLQPSHSIPGIKARIRIVPLKRPVYHFPRYDGIRKPNVRISRRWHALSSPHRR